MSLNITSITPVNGDNDIAIDSTIVIGVSEDIDPFSVANGINLYSEPTTQLQFDYQVNGNTIELTPSESLTGDTTFYIDIFPGNDVSRYISKRTVGTPVVVSENGSISINSSYTGHTNDAFEITFSSSNGTAVDTVDVAKGIKHVISSSFETDKEINLGELKITLSGTWDILDSISIPVYKASGLTDAYKTEFTTSKYTTVIPRSKKIEYLSDTVDPLRIVSTVPEDMSIGNTVINPIIIKFNKTLKANQDLANKIKIKRTDFNTGVTKNINQYYKIENDTVKIYMISTSRM